MRYINIYKVCDLELIIPSIWEWVEVKLLWYSQSLGFGISFSLQLQPDVIMLIMIIMNLSYHFLDDLYFCILIIVNCLLLFWNLWYNFLFCCCFTYMYMNFVCYYKAWKYNIFWWKYAQNDVFLYPFLSWEKHKSGIIDITIYDMIY